MKKGRLIVCMFLIITTSCNEEISIDQKLFEAVLECNIPLTDSLIKVGANVNSFNPISGKTIISTSIESQCDIKMLEILIASGAKINVEDEKSPLREAFLWCDEEAIKILIEHGADTSQISYGDNPIICQAAGSEYTPKGSETEKRIKLLLKYGANVNVRSVWGYPLIMTLENGKAEAALLLLKANADVNVLSNDGYSATHYAKLLKEDSLKKEIVKMIELKADKKQ